MRIIGPAVFGLFLAASACTTVYVPPPTPEQLAGPWRVIGINGGMVTAFNATISFGADGFATGHAACNDYQFAYTLDGKRLEFADKVMLTTDRFCDWDEKDIESNFLGVLGEVDHAGVAESGVLVLYAGGMRIVARRVKEASAPASRSAA
jgi:heat shock protein HslJ